MMLVKVKSDAKLEVTNNEEAEPAPAVRMGGKSIRIPDGEFKPLKRGIAVLDDPEAVLVDVVTLTATIQQQDHHLPTTDLDATEHSSSFADTLSDTDERCLLGNSEEGGGGEVESQFFGGDGDIDSPFDAFSSLFYSRKKKVTNHWRSFIRPLMWRCKWAELKIMEIESQALKYSGELTACEHRKQSSIYQSIPDGFCSKALPFFNECYYSRKSKRRRKRKRVDEAVDMSSIISDHPLFSYLESKRSITDGASLVDDFEPIGTALTDTRPEGKDKFGDSNDELSFAFGSTDNYYLENMLLNIEGTHSRVHKLKDQLDAVISNNASRFSSWDNLCLLAAPCDEGHTSSAPSPVLSVGCGGETLAHHTSGYDMSDLALPESAMSSFGEAIHVPDIIESTVGPLSVADVTCHEQQPMGKQSGEDMLENVVIKNEAADGEKEDVMVGASCNKVAEEEYHEKGETGESKNVSKVANFKTEEVETTATAGAGESSNLKSCLALDMQIPTNKRKRGERKTGSGTGGWKKKCSGDDDDDNP